MLYFLLAFIKSFFYEIELCYLSEYFVKSNINQLFSVNFNRSKIILYFLNELQTFKYLYKQKQKQSPTFLQNFLFLVKIQISKCYEQWQQIHT